MLEFFKMAKYPYTITSVWGADRTDPGLEGGINAITKGVTSSHVATTLYTTNIDSYDKAHAAGIPCARFSDNGVEVYQIHFSFGPARSDPANPGSKLDESYLINCLNAQLLTPAPEMSIIDQQENTVYSPLDPLRTNPNTLRLNPLSMVKFDTEEEGLIIQAFAEKLNLLLKQYLDPNNKERNTDARREIYFNGVKDAVSELKNKLDPLNQKTMDQFVYDFNKTKGTIGLRPEEAIETQLISSAQSEDGTVGFVEEDLVAKMVQFKQSIDLGKKEYNFVLDNCSHAVSDLFKAAANDPAIKGLMNRRVGYNDMVHHRFLPGILEFVLAGGLETPVNVAVNLIEVRRLLDKYSHGANLGARHPRHHSRGLHEVNNKPSPFTTASSKRKQQELGAQENIEPVVSKSKRNKH